MKKYIALLLALVLCTFAISAFAQSDDVITMDVTFQSQEITVDDLGVGFLIPADFVSDVISQQAASSDIVFSGTDAAGTYTMHVYMQYQTVDALMVFLDDNADVTQVGEVTINDIDLIGYALPSQNTFVVALPVGEESMLSFVFKVATDASGLSLEQMQIIGSLFDL
ncbi:MAG: hypothetical protein GX096_04685 [Clostridiales bacterium]|nr:hypothetical protein [Clostridiales bacterium]